MPAERHFPSMMGNYAEGNAMKILLWIIAIIFLIGLLVVSGVLKLIF